MAMNSVSSVPARQFEIIFQEFCQIDKSTKTNKRVLLETYKSIDHFDEHFNEQEEYLIELKFGHECLNLYLEYVDTNYRKKGTKWEDTQLIANMKKYHRYAENQINRVRNTYEEILLRKNNNESQILDSSSEV
jgi:hypothetical protein